MGNRTVYDDLWHLHQQPWSCLEEVTFDHLSTFVYAVSRVGAWAAPDDYFGSPDFRHFDWWIAAKRGDGFHTGGWRHFAQPSSAGDDALRTFFVELDLFRRSKLVVLSSANVPSPIVWPVPVPFPVVGGVRLPAVVSPVVSVEIATYDTVESCFLIAKRSDSVCTEHWCWTRPGAEELAAEALGVSMVDWFPRIGL